MTQELDPRKAVHDATSVVAALRKLIIDGHYPAGARLAEIPVSEALGVSRTPVRLAFRTLEQVRRRRGWIDARERPIARAFGHAQRLRDRSLRQPRTGGSTWPSMMSLRNAATTLVASCTTFWDPILGSYLEYRPRNGSYWIQLDAD